MRDKLPALQFYTADWRKDPCVQALDHEHKGVWIDLLCIMNETFRRGYLVLPSGAPMPDDAIARNLGLAEGRWKAIRRTLILLGVASENDAGALYNRRMARDEKLRAAKSRAGKRGGAVSGHVRRKARRERDLTTEANAKQNGSKDEAEGQAKQGSSVAVAVAVAVEPLGSGSKASLTHSLRAREEFSTLDLPGPALDVLMGMAHGGTTAATRATLEQRFLYAEGQGMPDPSVKGLPLEERRELVACALLEAGDQGQAKWGTPWFSGFVSRVRARGARPRENGRAPPAAEELGALVASFTAAERERWYAIRDELESHGTDPEEAASTAAHKVRQT